MATNFAKKARRMQDSKMQKMSDTWQAEQDMRSMRDMPTRDRSRMSREYMGSVKQSTPKSSK